MLELKLLSPSLSRCGYQEMVHMTRSVERSASSLLSTWTSRIRAINEEEESSSVRTRSMCRQRCRCQHYNQIELALRQVSLACSKQEENEGLLNLSRLLKRHVSINVDEQDEEMHCEDDSHEENSILLVLQELNVAVRQALKVDVCPRHQPKREQAELTQNFGDIHLDNKTLNNDVNNDVGNLSVGVARLRCDSTSETKSSNSLPSSPQRKRKQSLNRLLTDFSEEPAMNSVLHRISSPSKRARVIVNRARISEGPECLELLERQKKAVKNNGLYQFVLWREALKAGRASARRKSM